MKKNEFPAFVPGGDEATKVMYVRESAETIGKWYLRVLVLVQKNALEFDGGVPHFEPEAFYKSKVTGDPYEKQKTNRKRAEKSVVPLAIDESEWPVDVEEEKKEKKKPTRRAAGSRRPPQVVEPPSSDDDSNSSDDSSDEESQFIFDNTILQNKSFQFCKIIRQRQCPAVEADGNTMTLSCRPV